MENVKKYMVRNLNSVCEDDTLDSAIRYMHKYEMTILPVVDSENRFLGTIYSRNILKNILPEEYGYLESHRLLYDVNQAAENLKEIKGKRVKDYMSTNTIAVRETDTMDNIADVMLNNKESYLYVINEADKLRGYITRADLLYYLLEVGKEK
ncbi:MAG: hypothetical protein PWR10_1064 [Halanaerobiales bacterium]|nr:hypothetical protein [Halanaerobiales bacterium]